jgi:hypothetical protein
VTFLSLVLHDLPHVQISQVLSLCYAVPTSLLLSEDSGLDCFLLILSGGLRFSKEVLISLMAPTRKKFVPSARVTPWTPGASCILTPAGEVTQSCSETRRARFACCCRCKQTQHGELKVAFCLRRIWEVRVTV